MGLPLDQARALGAAPSNTPSRAAQLIAEANERRRSDARNLRGSATLASDPNAEAKASAGRAAKASGESTERLMAAACRYYGAHGRADMHKQHPEVVVIGGLDNGVFTGRFVGEAPIDYRGTVAGGLACHVEVKSSATTNLPLAGVGGPTLRPEQARDLAKAHQLGALAAVLVCICGRRPRGLKGIAQPGRAWFLLRWPGWLQACAAARAAGAASLSHQILGQFGKACPADQGWPDWLAVMENV